MQNNQMINVKQLSSRRLWEIIHLSDIKNISVSPTLVNHIIGELKKRNEYDQNQPWREPH